MILKSSLASFRLSVDDVWLVGLFQIWFLFRKKLPNGHEDAHHREERKGKEEEGRVRRGRERRGEGVSGPAPPVWLSRILRHDGGTGRDGAHFLAGPKPFLSFLPCSPRSFRDQNVRRAQRVLSHRRLNPFTSCSFSSREKSKAKKRERVLSGN